MVLELKVAFESAEVAIKSVRSSFWWVFSQHFFEITGPESALGNLQQSSVFPTFTIVLPLLRQVTDRSIKPLLNVPNKTMSKKEVICLSRFFKGLQK